jgi:hypothetical protein
MLKPEENLIELHYPAFQYGDLAVVEDQFARYGTEIESVYITGDFSVACEMTDGRLASQWSEWGNPAIPLYEVCRDSMRLQDPQPLEFGDVVSQGLPFYAGKVAYEVSVILEEPMPSGGVLDFGKFNVTVAEVLINGDLAGRVYAEPYQLNVGNLMVSGKNTIRVVGYNTMRNLLGPHHHPEGELCHVGPRHFTSREVTAADDPAEMVRQWGAGCFVPNDWRENYSVVGFGISDVSLVEKSS